MKRSAAAFILVLMAGTAAQAAPRPAPRAAPQSAPETLRPAEHLVGANAALCGAAIQIASVAAKLPPGLLGSVALVESGRLELPSRRVVSWPWTINVAGTGYFFETKADAIAAVERARAGGVQSIDVGCMQINLLHHPGAFASLDHAFDPEINAAYGAAFLGRLFVQTGAWPAAAAAYHSQTPGLADDYQRRVMAVWPLAAKYGFVPGAPAQRAIDPRNAYTPEFRTRLAQDAADRNARVAMGVMPGRSADMRAARMGRRLASTTTPGGWRN